MLFKQEQNNARFKDLINIFFLHILKSQIRTFIMIFQHYVLLITKFKKLKTKLVETRHHIMHTRYLIMIEIKLKSNKATVMMQAVMKN